MNIVGSSLLALLSSLVGTEPTVPNCPSLLMRQTSLVTSVCLLTI